MQHIKQTPVKQNCRDEVAKIYEHDIIVAGAGIAGHRAAFAAKSHNSSFKVAQLSMASDLAHGGCSWKTHGTNAAMNPEDSIENHIADTFRGGGKINDPDLVRALCEGAPAAIRDMEAIGVRFDKEGDLYKTGIYGGVTMPRSIHAGDQAGNMMVNRLREKNREVGVATFNQRVIVSYLIEDGQAYGAVCIDLLTGATEIHLAPKIISALGAGACNYPIATVNVDKTATGLVALLDAGAELSDMEQVQFHPTGLNLPGLPGHGEIIEEEVRSQGAKLLNRDGRRFMFDYDDRGEIATRDIVARSCYIEITSGRGTERGGVFLDMSGQAAEFLVSRFPFMTERVRAHGIDLATCGVLETSPAAHFLMGGIPIDIDGRTSIKGLYACGEDAGGIHGGNRLGGNGVADALVFGARAGAAAARDNDHFHGKPNLEMPVPFYDGFESKVAEQAEALIKQTMWTCVGPVRSTLGLEQAERALSTGTGILSAREVRVPANRITVDDLAARTFYQKVRLSQAIVRAALERTNSVGAHMRTDAENDNHIYTTRVKLVDDSLTSRRVYSEGTMSGALAPSEAA